MLAKLVAFVKSYPVVGSVLRFVRGAAAYGLAAALTWATNNYTTLDVPAEWIPFIGFAIQMLDKYLREKGLVRYTPK